MNPSITSFCFLPFITIGGISSNWSSLVIVLVPRILLRYLSGLTFEKLRTRSSNQPLSAMIAGIVGSLTNTVLVLSGIYLFFGQAYAQVLEIAYSSLIMVLMRVVVSNGIIEAILAALISSFAYRALKNK